MRILIGIPTFRRPEMLETLLASLAAQKIAGDVRPEVFVADNDAAAAEGRALAERLAPSFRFPLDAAVTREPGISANRNRILAEARARGVDCVAMIDDDEWADAGWLAALLAARTRYAADVVGGPVLYALPPGAPAYLAGSAAFPLKRGRSGPIGLLTGGGSMAIDCAALARAGWPMFDPRFGLSGGEDKEWFTRLAKAGLTFAWADDAIASEHVPAERTTLRAIVRRAYAIGGSDCRIDAAHEPAGAAARHLATGIAALASVVLLAPGLLLPRTRIILLRRAGRAFGRLSAAVGRTGRHYAASTPRPIPIAAE